LTEPAIKDALRAGRVYVGFDLVADSAGFRWFAANGTNRVVMGETISLAPDLRLHAKSPFPCRFTIVRDGNKTFQKQGYEVEWAPPGPGRYRVEAELKVLNEWIPWVYANPIELR